MTIDRRDFLRNSLLITAAGSLSLHHLWADDASKGEFDPDTLFLTWQRDPCTTMTIVWCGPDDDVNTRLIHYGKVGQEVAAPVVPLKRRFPKTENVEAFRAELTGLEPGSEYRFTIGDNSPTYRFRTMPTKATNGFRFVSGGDCGINRHAIASNQLAAKQDPMFILIAGDLGYDNGSSAGTALQFLRNYRQHAVDTQGRLIPLLTCLGNHEVRGGYYAKRKDATFYLPLFEGLYADTTYATLDFGDYLSLVLLDTNHVSPIAGAQTDWLDKTLADRTEVPHLIVANHVPAYPSHREFEVFGKGGTGSDNRKHWVPLFEKHNVDVVLEHHDHTFKRTHPLTDGHVNANGLVYLGDGSWGMLRPPASPEKRPYLAKVGMSYHVTVHQLEDDKRHHIAMGPDGRMLDVYSTIKRPRHAKGRGAPT
jgi:hypothetical protein